MRKSRIETAATRKRILSIASDMFLEHGLAAVGVRDIMAAARLTQGGFYRHFPSREQLIAEATAEAFDHILTALEHQILGKPPAEALARIVELYLAQAVTTKQAKATGHTNPSKAPPGKGARQPMPETGPRQTRVHLCPLSQLGVELRHCDAEVRAVARKGHRRLVRLIADQLPSRTCPESLRVANGIVSTLAGAVMLGGIATDRATSRAILADAKAAILTISLDRVPRPAPPSPAQPARRKRKAPARV